MTRRPAVAGQFYEGSRERLLAEIEDVYTDSHGPGEVPAVAEDGPRRLLGLVCPHAGYIYSGPIAAYAYAELARDGRPEAFVIIGPNHGRGSWTSAVQTAGGWLTPLGEALVHEELAGAIAAELPGFSTGAEAFRAEHSIEVQLPFLQHLYGGGVKFVPVMMLEQEAAAAREVGMALGKALAGRNVVIIASTDMTHQEPRQVATAQDGLLAEKIVAMDAEGLLVERDKRDITMCGYGATAAMLIAAQMLGATEARLLRYGDSGEVAVMPTVVGYLAAAVYR
ncbi:MAG: AmmeMemoRadiSam system protein B [Armatimonadia bacterium]